MHDLTHITRRPAKALVLVGSVAALTAPTAFGGFRPDDRAGTHGASASALTNIRQTDPRARGPLATSGKSSRRIDVQRPDDRAGVRGIGGGSQSSARPDDRAGIRGVGA
jgi:hypothetical protein